MGKNSAEYQREWRARNPEKARQNELRRNYGIDLALYDALFDAQKGCCAICKTPAGEIGTGFRSMGRLAVDHCHSSGIVRGLLCTNCNLGLGSFRDNPELLKAATAYLESKQELAKAATLCVDSLLDELSRGP